MLLQSILERLNGATYLQLADCFSKVKHHEGILSILLVSLQ